MARRVCKQATATIHLRDLRPDWGMHWHMHGAYLLLLLQLLRQLCHSAGAHLYGRLWERHHRVQSGRKVVVCRIGCCPWRAVGTPNLLGNNHSHQRYNQLVNQSSNSGGKCCLLPSMTHKVCCTPKIVSCRSLALKMRTSMRLRRQLQQSGMVTCSNLSCLIMHCGSP